jgi:hypothetical protein
MRLRFEARRPDDVLLLPARNFHVTRDERLESRFRAFMRGELLAEEIAAQVSVKRFPFESLRKFYIRSGGTGKRFAVDYRGLVFAKSQNGQDGGHHDIATTAHRSLAYLRRELERRFRFGTPLEPAGFQHDVQWEGGADLVKERFDCSERGPVQVSGDHANVFPSDVVKGSEVRNADK